jgi:hypothetical protein
MTGYELANFPEFDKQTEDLRAVGWDIVSPHEIDQVVGMTDVVRGRSDEIIDVILTGAVTYEGILGIDLAVIATCDAIILLPGWTKSNGAKRELTHALSLGLAAYTLEEALRA